ncbi:MAG: FdhF/YdeP family oxidoreductase [Candidatus Obscuribacterales bacterium]|nr:FdhF/YdeP family oxidoreductase [Candidatus Obscuribacterales bacterium]
MARKTKPGGGWQAVRYTIEKSLEVGPIRMWHKMRSKNACKTCALGMGGLKGGMVNENGHFPEVCKKSLQAQAVDMAGTLAEDFFKDNSLASLLALTPKKAEDLGRLTYPVILEPGKDKFRQISWQEAIKFASDPLKHAKAERKAFYASGRSSNEAAFLLQSFARVFGTNHVMNCSYYCHQASGVGLKMAFGVGTATLTLEDIALSDLVFLIGANPASNHPRLMTQLADLRERGGDVIVVNPIREPGLEVFHVPSKVKSMLLGTKIASHYVQPLAGGDVALMVGMLKSIDEKGKLDTAFLESHSEGFQEVLAHAKELTWQEIESGSGVDKATIEKTADMISAAKRVIFAWAMGLTHHSSGVDNVLALCNLAVATGHVGKPGAGMLPIRGHSNVQGIGSIGFTPALQDSVKTALEKAYGKPFPNQAGYDTFTLLEAAEKRKVDYLFCLGGNLWGSNPDLDWASRAMQNIDTIIYLSTKLNPGHFHGRGKTTLILPVLARDEEPQSTSQESMFNFVRLSEGGSANVGGILKAESEIICDIADKVLGSDPVDWNRLRDHKQVRKLLAEVTPGWQELASIDQTRKEFTIEGRIFHTPSFKTDSGKAIMHKTPLPEVDPDGLTLVSLRSEGQFNTVVYEEHDIYRGIPHRFCIFMSQEDADKHQVKDGQRVKVKGEAGEMKNIEVVIGNIKSGVVAMFYPESNVLIKPRLDRRSKTPAFKSAPVTIEATSKVH